MTDVWRCCSCGGANLIANADVKCPVCSHPRCHACPTGPPTLADHTSTSESPSVYLPLPSTYGAVPRHSYPSTNTGYALSNGAGKDTSGFWTTHLLPSGSNYSYTSSSSPVNTYGACSSSRSGSGPRPYHHGRPSMTNWWTCHNCGQTNNPALAPEKCSNCTHSVCGNCTVYG